MATNDLTKKLVKLHQTHGYRADEYFRWMIDDCLAGFGRRLSEDDLPPEKVRQILFELGQLYSREIQKRAPFEDVLGDSYQELSSQFGRKALGQYFTPWPIAKLMASLQQPGNAFETQTVVRYADLGGCGSGALLLAAASTLIDTNAEWLKKLSVTGIDLDPVCAKMFPLQFLGNCLVHQVEVGEVLSYQGNGLGPFENLDVVVHATARTSASEKVVPAKHALRKEMIEEAQRKQLSKEDQIALPF